MKTKNMLVVAFVLVTLLVTAKAALGDVYINEFTANSDDKIELYNDASADVNLTGWTIEDKVSIAPLDGLTIKANSVLLLPDKILALNKGGDQIILKNDKKAIVDDASYGSEGSVLNPDDNQSVGRQHDGSRIFKKFTTPTFGTTNGNANAVPTGTVPNQTLTEGKIETVTVDLSKHITDADGDTLDFSDVSGASGVKCTVKDSTLTITLEKGWTQDAQCNLRVKDGFSTTSFKVENTIIPAIKLIDGKTTVKVADKTVTFDPTKSINTTPGDKVKVDFEYGNNLDSVLGYIEITAKSDQTPEFKEFPYTKKDFALPPVIAQKDSLSFTVPHGIGGKFAVTLTVADEDENGNKYKDSIVLNFNTLKETKSVVVENVSVADKTLTCSKNAQVSVELTNTGEKALAPDIRIFEKPATLSNKDGETWSFPSGTPKVKTEVKERDLAPGATTTVKVPVNVSSLSGKQTLYVYVVSPFFYNSKDGFYVGASTSVKLDNVGPCLDTEAIEDVLFTEKNGEAPLPVKLLDKDSDGEYIYINEDKTVTPSFSLKEESDKDLLACKIVSNELSCEKPTKDESGSSDLTITVKESSTSSEFDEEVEVVVADTLEIEELRVDNEIVEHHDDLGDYSPLEELELEVDLANYLPAKATSVVAKVSAFSKEFKSKTINLDEDEEDTLTVKVTIPKDTKTASYPVTVVVEGKDGAKKLVSDVLAFNLEVVQDVDGIVISNVELKDSNSKEVKELTCSTDAVIHATLTNTGETLEDDVVLVVKGTNFEQSSENETIKVGPVLENGGETAYSFKLDTSKLTVGSNNLDVYALYRNKAYKTATEKFTLKKNSCLKAWYYHDDVEDEFVDETSETESRWTLKDNTEMKFKVDLVDNKFASGITWFVQSTKDKEPQESSHGQTFSFKTGTLDTYKIHSEYDGEKTLVWEVEITNIPSSNDLTTNIPEDVTEEELEDFEKFKAENSHGVIEFTDNVDLSDIFGLDEIIKIKDGVVSVDTSKATDLAGKKATVTLKKSVTDPIILVSKDGKTFNACPATQCKVVSKDNGKVVFTVEHFTHYKVVENKAAGLAVSKIEFKEVTRGADVELNVVVENKGAYGVLKDVKAELVGLTNYKATIEAVDKELDPNEKSTVKLKLTVPTTQDAGNNKIGTLKVTSSNDSVEEPIYLSTKDYLEISKIEVNGKSNGDLRLDDSNEIEFEVENKYKEDMEDVQVTVRILEKDGSEIDEEEADEFDLRDGDDEKVKVEFNLDEDDLEDEEYVIEITVEAEADDDTDHEAKETKNVDLDIEKHKVILENVHLDRTMLTCSRNAYLSVDIKNVGSSNEDEIEVHVRNSELGLNLFKKDLELDKFSRNDNEDRITFGLNLDGVAAGSYPLDIELLLDGKAEDSESATVTVKECATSSTSQQQQVATQQVAKQTQQQLEQLYAQQQFQQGSTVQTSFRESNTYVLLLGVLALLVFMAIVMAMAVLLFKKRR